MLNVARPEESVRTSDRFLLDRIPLVLSHIFEEGPAQVWVVHCVLGQSRANYFRFTNISLAVLRDPEIDATPPWLEIPPAQKAL